ncbi:hypothetical protein DF3PA_70111 [Candidatus Defluviicoccus seviourii]|uniref:Uncharacterized protein n=1 Tax=Candidatus Defluviicoccus seviourii TaxID=2565273 RepID=A0A564WH43_9PROT|nr:hypothetical protein DF3PA_70111 [Candidatus Defluviicoccus seviourii]
MTTTWRYSSTTTDTQTCIRRTQPGLTQTACFWHDSKVLDRLGLGVSKNDPNLFFDSLNTLHKTCEQAGIGVDLNKWSASDFTILADLGLFGDLDEALERQNKAQQIKHMKTASQAGLGFGDLFFGLIHLGLLFFGLLFLWPLLLALLLTIPLHVVIRSLRKNRNLSLYVAEQSIRRGS